jgi:hypothetical protein
MPLWRATNDDTASAKLVDDRIDEIEKVPHGNISLQTLLATDYLNHFVEIIMLIELLPDMPELIAECRDWEPLSYKEHFERSRIADRDLALEAYALVPERYRKPLETTSGELHVLVRDRLDRLFEALEREDPDTVARTSKEAVRTLNNHLQKLNGIIHGGEFVLAQKEIDKLVRKSAQP